jgi:hypothetical protein
MSPCGVIATLYRTRTVILPNDSATGGKGTQYKMHVSSTFTPFLQN